MGDLVFVAVAVAFFASTVAYVKGCERIVGPETGVGPEVDVPLGASPGSGREGGAPS